MSFSRLKINPNKSNSNFNNHIPQSSDNDNDNLTKNDGISIQEQDQLQRSNKKFKRKITHEVFGSSANSDDSPMEEDRPDQLGNKNGGINNVGYSFPTTYTTTFRDMLNNKQGASNDTSGIQNSNPFNNTVNDDDLASDDDEPPESEDSDTNCPVILLTKEEKKRMRQPWKTSLIIKMFDKQIGYLTLLRRLTKKWQIKGQLSLIDIGYSYYIAKFTSRDDYEYVLTEGPWMIDDHYLTIRKWIPNFTPDDAPIKILNAWVRIPNLAVEYFDSVFLHKVGAKIGKVIKIDTTTAKAARGKFIRMCVEIDLSKPLLSKFWLKGKVWKIQYEGLRLICYNCGKINHKEEDCPDLDANKEKLAHAMEQKKEKEAKEPEATSTYGDWMLVKKPVRNRNTAKQSKNAEGSSSKKDQSNVHPNQTNLKQNLAGNQALKARNPNLETSSRFEILNEELPISEPEINPIPKDLEDSVPVIAPVKGITDKAILDIQEQDFRSCETINLAESTPQDTQNLSFAIGKFKERFTAKVNPKAQSQAKKKAQSQVVNQGQENLEAISLQSPSKINSQYPLNNHSNKGQAISHATSKPTPLQSSQAINIPVNQISQTPKITENNPDQASHNDTPHLNKEIASRMDHTGRKTYGDASHGNHATNDPPDGGGPADMDGDTSRATRTVSNNDNPIVAKTCPENAN